MNTSQVNADMMICHIRMDGNLDDKWSDWFDGFVMASRNGGETLLSGAVVDQAALHGVLDKIQNLGLSLRLVIQTECPCSSKNCVQRGNCLECAAFHSADGKQPYCFRERTRWNKQCKKVGG